MKTYILDENKNPVEATTLEWAEWSEDFAKNRRVDLDELNGYRVSTVFLGLDHSVNSSGLFGDKGLSVLWETMIFKDGYSELYCDRYTSYEDALKGHARAVELAKEGNL